ncbi:cytochrome P450 27C1-like [Porites lutea]|uniref:cytochrome P450 27C1-like n=1 Tax=Porites lutea TaxID=51062 RepID=UPI003CC56D3D
MFSSCNSFRGNIVIPKARHLKGVTSFWRWQKTEARPLENRESFNDLSTKSAENTEREVRPFNDIPALETGLTSTIRYFRETEGFTKVFKLSNQLFTKHGPIFREDSFFGSPAVHIIDPDDFEKVFRSEGRYPRRPPMEIWIEHRKRRNYFPGVFNAEGEEWYRIRKTIAPKIMRPKIVEENIDNFNAVTKDTVARFVKLNKACGPNDHIPDLEGELIKWSTEICPGISTVAFDTRLGLYDDSPPPEALLFIREVQNFFALSHKLLFSAVSRFARQYFDTPLLKRFLKCGDTILDIGQGFVDKKMKELKEMTEKGIDPSDNSQVVSVLTYLLTKEDLTPEEVNGHAIDVVAGGVDTTSVTALWWLYNLARFPHVQEKIYEEIQSVVGIDGEVTPHNLAKLHYLKASLKESLRLTPTAAGLQRILDQGVVLSGYHVPAQTIVLMEFFCTTLSGKYYKDSLEFQPERWLRENKDENHPFSNLPFGFGTRMCLGRRVAELTLYILVCKLLQRFRLEYHHEPLESYQKLFAVPDRPVKIKFVDRL